MTVIYLYHYHRLCLILDLIKFMPTMPITSVQVFLGRPRQRPLEGLSFWTFFSQPLLRSTCPCHLSRWVSSTVARSTSCITSKRSCQLMWSLVVTPHIQCIIAWSLRWRRYKPDKYSLLVHGIKFESFVKFIFELKTHSSVGLSICNICTIFVYRTDFIIVQLFRPWPRHNGLKNLIRARHCMVNSNSYVRIRVKIINFYNQCVDFSVSV